ncbi:MAG: Pseudouridine synthase [Ilumatobacteraceae bacterium]|nr:Pseudouridine synthase [Ilumatobacteraceae bacterium]
MTDAPPPRRNVTIRTRTSAERKPPSANATTEVTPVEERVLEKPLWEQWADQRAEATGERLQKVLALRGWGSRRVCEDLIAAGRVSVNGDVAVLGRRVDIETDIVEVDGVPVGLSPDIVYYLLNKPTGVITTASDPQGRPTVVSLVPDEPRVFSVGRLDADTEGLLLLTNDGELANRISHPSHGVEKEYLASVDGEVPNRALRRLRDGIELDDGMTAPARASQLSPGLLRITIHEGRNRQVRRMCEAIGFPVRRLVRVRIGPIRDTSLAPGEWRTLSNDEVRQLAEAVAGTPRSYDRRP